MFKKIFECNESKFNLNSPLNHECITFTNLEKYQMLGKVLLMFVDVTTNIWNLKDIDFLTEDFM